MIALLSFSASYEGTFWYSDSLKSLNEVKVSLNAWETEFFLHLRDYRPYSPITVHGDTYKLALFRFYARKSFGPVTLSVGDEPLVFGRGLSLFLEDDEKVLLESTLRGIQLGNEKFRAYAGLKRRWIYYSSDRDTLLLGGIFLTPIPNLGFNFTYYDVYGRGGGFLPGAYASFPLGQISLYLEGAYRYGYDVGIYGEDYGYALYGNLEYSSGDKVLGVELKDYYRIFQEFNLPAPANGYGLLPTEGRDEVGGNVHLSYSTFFLELGRSYDHELNLVMKFYSLSYYRDVGRLTPKFGGHHLDWGNNLRERTLFFEIKGNFPAGLIVYTEYRNRLYEGRWEDQPYASLTLMKGGLAVSISGRMYSLRGKRDATVEISYENFSFLRLLLSYGSFSGDVVCSGGVCRYEPPFSGLKVGAAFHTAF